MTLARLRAGRWRQARLTRRAAVVALLAGTAGLAGLASSTYASTLQQRAGVTARASSLALVTAQSPLLQSPPSATRSYWLQTVLHSIALSDRAVVSADVVDAAGHPLARDDGGVLAPIASAVRVPGGAVVRAAIPGGGAIELTLAPTPILPWSVVTEALAALALGAVTLLIRRRAPAAATAVADDLVHGAGVIATHADDADGDGARILLVDDDESVRRYLGTVLTRAGYRVTMTATPLEALRLCREGHVPDLLVSDIVLPTMSGHELASVVNRLHPQAGALLISGYPEERALVRPGDSFLAKPFSGEELLEAVSTTIAARAVSVAAVAAQA
jgi:CheY-like chemotaxis protein